MEKELLSLVSKGDEAAFTVLFNAYHQRLGAYIYRLTESLPATQEIVQDVFVKIWLRRENLRGIDRFDAYLFVAARNHAYNYFRKMARERVQHSTYTETVPSAVEDVLAQEPGTHQALLDQAIGHLPPRQQQVYILHRREGLSHAEIARELHLSLETVKKHMSLALRGIRDFLSVT
jgi:RNA polymerase sigma-70 factor (family 1)